MGWAAESWLLYGLALREGARAGLDLVRRGLRGPAWRVPKPERLLFAPRDLRTSDPTDAADMEAGLFTFAGRVVDTGGRSPFASSPPSRAWAEALYGFGWLRHHKAAGTALARENARRIVADAIGPRRRQLERGLARDPQVVSRRVISFLCQSPVLLNGADAVFYARFLKTIGRGVAALERDAARSRAPLDRLAAATALSYAALCCSGLENRLRRATRLLSAELDRQILADGGHVSRNPGVLVDLLLDLLPLRLLYKSRGIDAPPALGAAIERMMPMVRFLRHGSGELALFNGMGATPTDRLATLLSYDNARAPLPDGAAASGYGRLQAGDTLLLMEAGATPPRHASAAAASGCLSFELSDGARRLVVNRGAVRNPDGPAVADRATAAHSTLVIVDAPSAIVLDRQHGRVARWLDERLGAIVLAGPETVAVARAAGPDGTLSLAASHDGYGKRFGVTHERKLALSADGARLDGEDRLVSASSEADHPDATVHFHLHPTVQIDPVPETGALRLRAPGGEPWLFSAEGAPPQVRDSIYRGGQDGWRPTRQIALSLPAGSAGLRWRFERPAAPPPDEAVAAEVAPEEPAPMADQKVPGPASGADEPGADAVPPLEAP